MVRRALTWLGWADPLAGTAQLESADPVRRKLRALLLAWYETFRSTGATSKEAVTRARETQPNEEGDAVRPAQALWETLTEYFTDRRGDVRSQLVGEFIRKSDRRVEAGMRFENFGSTDNRQIWRVVIVDEQRFQKFHARGKQGHEGHEGNLKTEAVGNDPHDPHDPKTPSSENYGAPVSSSLLVNRILATLQSCPGGMTQEDLVRLVGNSKGASPAMVEMVLIRLMKEGAIGKLNGRLVVNP